MFLRTRGCRKSVLHTGFPSRNAACKPRCPASADFGEFFQVLFRLARGYGETGCMSPLDIRDEVRCVKITSDDPAGRAVSTLQAVAG